MAGRRNLKMSELKAMTAVYCYIFPETWKALEEVQQAVDRPMFLRTAPVQEIADMFEGIFDPPLDFPAIRDGPLKGSISLDELFIPVSKQIIDRYSVIIPGITDFENVYPCAGSSDAIVKTLTILKVQGTPVINVLRGEYEGYGITARALGMEVREHDPETLNPRRIQPGVWYISNPSAIDGNILPDELISELLGAGHRLVLDFAYAGSTKPHVFNADHDNIAAVLLSPSKPYGVFEERVTGFALLREQHFPKAQANNFLYGNRWFTDKVRTLQALKLVQVLGPKSDGSTPLYDKYRPVQEGIVGDLVEEHGLPFKVSDAFLIAHINAKDAAKLGKEQLELIAPYQRGAGYRLCLTPYFEMREKQEAK